MHVANLLHALWLPVDANCQVSEALACVLLACLQVGPGVNVHGTDCDVSSSASVARLAAYAKSRLGRIDVWINNAGYSGSFQVLAAMHDHAACSTAATLVDAPLCSQRCCTWTPLLHVVIGPAGSA